MYQEDIIIINIYAPTNRAPKYMRQKLTELKEDVHSSNNNGSLQHSTFSNGDDNQTKEQQGNGYTPQMAEVSFTSSPHHRR